jgi:hypothetical protein
LLLPRAYAIIGFNRQGRRNISVLKKLFFIVMLVIAGTSVSLSRAEQLSGRRAAEYINGFAERFTGRQYSALTLERRNRSAETGGMIDALVFIPARGGPGNNKYRFIRRLDDDYVLRLYTVEGREPAAVVPGDVPRYRKVIKDNMMSAYVILDKGGAEVMTVYCGLRPCNIVWNREQNGEIYLELHKTFKNEGFREPDLSRELFK